MPCSSLTAGNGFGHQGSTLYIGATPGAPLDNAAFAAGLCCAHVSACSAPNATASASMQRWEYEPPRILTITCPRVPFLEAIGVSSSGHRCMWPQSRVRELWRPLADVAGGRRRDRRDAGRDPWTPGGPPKVVAGHTGRAVGIALGH